MPRCLACGCTDLVDVAVATDIEYFTSSAQYRYLRCLECEALSIDPLPKAMLDEIYPDNYYSYDDESTASLSMAIKNWLDRKFFARMLSQVQVDQVSVLDVGGGAGHQLDLVRDVDARVSRTVVVDLDHSAEARAIAKGHEFFCGPFESYRTETRFDLILMLNLIEHVDEPGATLRQARELLNPGGCVVIKTPNTDSLDARIFGDGSWGGFHCPRHWVLFNRENLLSLAGRNGLALKKFSYQQGAPFWSTSVMAKLYQRGLVSLSASRPVFEHPMFGLLLLVFACLDVPRSWFFKTSQMLVVFGGDK